MAELKPTDLTPEELAVFEAQKKTGIDSAAAVKNEAIRQIKLAQQATEKKAAIDKGNAIATGAIGGENRRIIDAMTGQGGGGAAVQSQINIANSSSAMQGQIENALMDARARTNEGIAQAGVNYATNEQSINNQIAEAIAQSKQNKAKELLNRQQYLADLADERAYNITLRDDEREYAAKLSAQQRAEYLADVANQREYEKQMTADQRAYNEKITKEARSYDIILKNDERAYAAKLSAQQRAEYLADLSDQRKYEATLTADQRAYAATLKAEDRATYLADLYNSNLREDQQLYNQNLRQDQQAYADRQRQDQQIATQRGWELADAATQRGQNLSDMKTQRGYDTDDQTAAQEWWKEQQQILKDNGITNAQELAKAVVNGTITEEQAEILATQFGLE